MNGAPVQDQKEVLDVEIRIRKEIEKEQLKIKKVEQEITRIEEKETVISEDSYGVRFPVSTAASIAQQENEKSKRLLSAFLPGSGVSPTG
ncbi:hypothetical protein MP638_002987 [Amoeboaphelidium occidentale]|nr:hypothetical protein MP638_002987 [Amoeboaphelidium occidentale]